jgi:thioredoxin reductase (NADPH)
MDKKDLIIIGAGSAGLSAGIFGARLGMDSLIIEMLMPGGLVINSEKIEDYPGIAQGISGSELIGNMQTQALESGAEIILSEVNNIKKNITNDNWIVETYETSYDTKSIIIASGSKLKKLNVPGEEHLTGSGVSYCATCDGAFFLDQNVCVVGDGDSALEEALTLTQFAKNINIYSKNSHLQGQKILQNKILEHPQIQVHYQKEIIKIHGDTEVEKISLVDTNSQTVSSVDTNGVFIFIGLEPNTEYLKGLLKLDCTNKIPTDISMRSILPGILAAGDIRKNSASQLITTSGDGVTAALSAYEYIRGNQWEVQIQ